MRVQVRHFDSKKAWLGVIDSYAKVTFTTEPIHSVSVPMLNTLLCRLLLLRLAAFSLSAVKHKHISVFHMDNRLRSVPPASM